MHIDPRQVPTDLKEPAMDAVQPPDRPDVSDAAAAERERIKAAGAVSACCGTTYTRPRERYGRWTCDGCGRECDLIGVIG